jgi:hypothetical protein
VAAEHGHDAAFMISTKARQHFRPFRRAMSVYNYCASFRSVLKLKAQKLGADPAAWSSSWVHLLGLRSFDATGISSARTRNPPLSNDAENGQGRRLEGNWLE